MLILVAFGVIGAVFVCSLVSAQAQIIWQAGVDQNITPATRQALERLQQAYGGPITISSGYRDEARNSSTPGAASGSQHTHGTALDISTPGMSPEDKGRLVAAAAQSGFRGIGFYGENGHIHIDTRQNWATWGQRPRGVDEAMRQHIGNNQNRPVDASQNQLNGQTGTQQPGQTSGSQTGGQGTGGTTGTTDNVFPWISWVFRGTGNVNQPQSMGPAGTMTSIGDPTICWVCDMIVTTMKVVETMVKAAIEKFSLPLLGLVVVFAMIGVCWRGLRALVDGTNIFQGKLIPMLGRLAIVGALLGSSGVMTALAFQLFVGPPIMIGATAGTALADQASTAFGYSPQNVTCSHDQPSARGISELREPTEQLTKLACRVHTAASVGILLGGLLASHPTKDSSFSDKAVAIVLFVVGLFLMYSAFMALLNFGFAMVETLVVSVIIAVFMPFLIAMAVFESTKESVKVLFQNALFVIINLIVTGALAVAVVFILMMSFSLGLGLNTASTDAQAVVTGLSSMYTGNDLFSAAGWAKALKFVAFALAGTFAVARLMAAGQSMAVEVTGYALGQVGALGQAGQGAMGRVTSTVMAVAAPVALAGGAAAGGAAAMATRIPGLITRLRSAAQAPSVNPNVTVR
ncbi:MAG: DUF882 domain-containing protein [Phreatobacter sp.]|nr:DUF882 domain-containing protein [Phreatobacter sp.]